ncbi:MAG TPA: hypothetical protein VFI02_09705, partial [Armatimonadota bacterium]|nr:hypothetical protein [Armatimonadota bacterium]
MGLSSSFLAKSPVLMIMSIAPAWLAGIALAVSFQPAVYKRIEKWRLPLAVGVYILTRFVLFYVIYIVLSDRKIGGDLLWYQWEGQGALAGKIPYAEFRCDHAPLFPYLMAACYSIWSYIASPVLLFILLDIVTLILLCKITRRLLGPESVMNVAWLYVWNPAIWIITARYGQDETVVSALLLLAVYLYMTGSKWLNPIVLVLGTLITKYTTAIGMAAVYAYSKTKARDALVVLGLGALVCVPFYLKGADLLDPVVKQGLSIEGVNVASVLGRLVVPQPYLPLLHHLVSIAAVLAFGIVLYLGHRRGLPIAATLTACLIVFLVFAPKSYKFYRLWFLGLLGMHAVQTHRMNRFVL